MAFDARGHHYGVVNISGSANVQLGDRCEHKKLTKDDYESKYNNLLNSLLFDRIEFRVNNVRKALLSTCEWWFRHPSFQIWYNDEVSNEHNNFFWIKGKPGCGKSTLMKAALERARRRKCENRARQAIVPYFFNARASSALEKSALGLYRTIVYHLLSSGDLLRPLFIERFALKNPGLSGENWTVEELQGFLFDSVECDEPFELCLFIDALDEAQYEDDVRDMVSFLIQLADRASATKRSCHLRICLSSRHYPNIGIGRGLSLIVEDQHEHRQDIDIYINKQLTCLEGSEKDDLRCSILEKSAHIFLWVVLVVEILNRLDDSGATLSYMQTRLETIPANLNELFREILLKSDHEIESSVLLFQWCVFAMRPLTPEELYVAMQYSRFPNDLAWVAPTTIALPHPDRLGRQILSCSRGLVEIVEDEEGILVVQFIHETVREFLLTDNGLASAVPGSTSNLVGISHEILRVACHRYVSISGIPRDHQHYCNNHDIFHRDCSMYSDLPLLEYSVSNLFRHAEEAQKHGIAQKAFLEAQLDERGCWTDPFRVWWQSFPIHLSPMIDRPDQLFFFVVEQRHRALTKVLLGVSKINEEYGRMVQLALHRNDLELARELVEKAAGVSDRCTREHRSALYMASIKGYLVMVQFLLDKDRDLNTRVKPRSDTALHTASEIGYEQLCQLLSAKGADYNTTSGLCEDSVRCVESTLDHLAVIAMLIEACTDSNVPGNLLGSSLQVISYLGYGQIVQLLLEKGADVNAQGGFRGTALNLAAELDCEQVMQILLVAVDLNARDEYYLLPGTL